MLECEKDGRAVLTTCIFVPLQGWAKPLYSQALQGSRMESTYTGWDGFAGACKMDSDGGCEDDTIIYLACQYVSPSYESLQSLPGSSLLCSNVCM